MGELAQLITAFAALIAAFVGVGSLLISMRNGRRIDAQAIVLDAVKTQTNGLLAHAEAAATAKGKVSGIAEGKRQGLDQAAADRSRE